jgi:hypothetical protein
MRAFILFLCVGIETLALAGNVFYVSLSGSDSNNGTQEQPWRTIQRAANMMYSGDTVLVGPGDYGEIITTPRNATNAYITFDGGGAAQVKQFQISKANIRVRNFTITGLTTRFTGAINLFLGAHGAFIDGNYIDCAYADSVRGINWDFGSQIPIDPGAASNVIISNNTIEHVYNTVTVMLFGSNSLVISNRMRDIRDSDYFHCFGISNVIRGNICIGFQDTTNSGNHMDCFQTFGNNGHASKYITIERNIFGYNHRPTDIDHAQLCQMEQNNDQEIHDWNIRNNVFFNLLKGECGVPSVRWNNNVFYQIWTNSAGGALILNWSADGRNNATNSEIVNNVFLECARGDSQSGWYLIGDNSWPLTNSWTVDYNYVGGTNGSPKNAGLPRTNQRWFELHGVNGGDPRFVDSPNKNFHVLSGSPLIDAGLDLSSRFTNDLEGRQRPMGGKFDIGAFEFGRPPAPRNLRIP